MRRPGLPLPILLPVLLPALFLGCGFGDRSDILILVRAGDPVSRAIAADYAEARDVPENRILELTLSADRDAIEIDTETYLREIATPIERHLEIADPGGEIAVLITTRGLPLRIGHCDPEAAHYPKDCRSAAVDAALAQLGRTGAEGLASARVENPFFRDLRSFEQFRTDSPESALRFLVARLSASGESRGGTEGSPPVLADMIDRSPPPASAATRAAPLWRVVSENSRSSRTAAASALLDSIEDQLPLFGHRVCDGCAAAEEHAHPTGIILQSDVPDRPTEPASNRLAYPGFVIRLDGTPIDREPGRGAGSDFDRFVTRWFARGAGAISTHVADPSLPDVTRPTALLTALVRGSSAVEAHFKSVPQLGWVNVFVGDPLLALPDDARMDEDTRDQDRDSVADAEDNCRDDPNADQRDTNADGFGNACDPDVDDDGLVETSWGAIYPVDRRGDLEAISLTARNGPYDEDHDLDGDGRVDERDWSAPSSGSFEHPGVSQ